MSRQTHHAETLKVFLPLHMHRRGARKVVISPVGAVVQGPTRPPLDNATIKALARAHLWRRRIEAGEFASITELAKAEGVNHSYVCRLLRLTLLAPKLVEAIVEGQPSGITLKELMRGFPQAWSMQTFQGICTRWVAGATSSQKARGLGGGT